MKRIFYFLIILFLLAPINIAKEYLHGDSKYFEVEILSSKAGYSIFINGNFITNTPGCLTIRKNDIITLKIEDIYINYVYQDAKKLYISVEKKYIFINQKKYIQIVEHPDDVVEEYDLWGLVILDKNIKIKKEIAEKIKELVVCVENFPDLNKFENINFISFKFIKNIEKNISYLKAPDIKYLNIKDCVATKKVINWILDLKNLLSINLENTASFEELMDFKYNEEKIKLISNLTTLRYLNLSSNPIDDNALQYIGKIKDLEVLDLSYVAKITEKGISYLPKTIKSLNLRSTNLNDNVLEVLSKFKNIHSINLTNTKISGTKLMYIKNLKNVESLALSGVNLRNIDHDNFKLPNLKILTIRNCSSITTMLSIDLHNLRKIDLSGTDVTDNDINILSEKSKYLKTIYLNDTKITNDALKSLQSCNSLLKLGLQNTEVDQDGFKYFGGYHHLVYLSIGRRTKYFLDRKKIVTKDKDFLFLAKLKKIKYLYFSNIAMGDGIFYQLKSLPIVELFIIGANLKSLSGIENLKYLESLNVSFNKLTDNEKVYLRKLPELLYLDITGTDIDPSSLHTPFLKY